MGFLTMNQTLFCDSGIKNLNETTPNSDLLVSLFLSIAFRPLKALSRIIDAISTGIEFTAYFFLNLPELNGSMKSNPSC